MAMISQNMKTGRLENEKRADTSESPRACSRSVACDVEIAQENESFENLGADSLDVVELVLAAEVEFGIEISALQDFNTVKDLVDFVEKKLN